MKILYFGLVNLIYYILVINAAIIPQELPSILSLIYSNIPPIKKGTDSRVGFGYRLGEHADFQVLFELGPQTNTKPIGNVVDSDSSDTSKRNVNQDDYKEFSKKKEVSPNQNGTNWLTNWSQDMKQNYHINTNTKNNIINNNNNFKNNLNNNNNNKINEVLPIFQMMPIIPDSSLKQLQQLYGIKSEQPQQQQQQQQQQENVQLINNIDETSTKLTTNNNLTIDYSFRNLQYPIPTSTTIKYNNIGDNNNAVNLLRNKQKDTKKVTADLMDVEFDE